jgi:glucosamine-6-phosphate deaminase
MQIRIIDDDGARAAMAADRISMVLASSPRPVFGVATGSSPLAVYDELAQRLRAGRLSFTGVTVFALDEYLGLGPRSPSSYAWFVDRFLRRPLGLDAADIHVPDGLATEMAAACASYEQAILDAGGIDVQIAGIGENGHLAFNEPGSPLDSRTRVVELTESTLSANSRNFDDPAEMPTQAVTQGLGTVSDARSIVVVAQGFAKAAAVRAAIEGRVSVDCPASVLQRHPDVLWILDSAAASALDSVVRPRHCSNVGR